MSNTAIRLKKKAVTGVFLMIAANARFCKMCKRNFISCGTGDSEVTGVDVSEVRIRQAISESVTSEDGR